MTDYLIAGLGNPGRRYSGNRHNAGAEAVEKLARRHGTRLHSGTLAETGEARMLDARVLLLIPRTFYNGSGRAVQHFLRQKRIPVENAIVIYDDLDLEIGRLRLRPRGGDGGNNGLKSIIEATGSQEFGRVRIGIGRPLHMGVPSWDPEVVMRYVLAPPSRQERETLDGALERACDAVVAVLRDGWERAMDVFNRASQPA